MRLKTTLIMIALCLTAGCQFLTTTDAAHLRADAPANMVQECAPPEVLPAKVDMGELLTFDGTLADQYWQCANRHNELVKWLKREEPFDTRYAPLKVGILP